MTAIDAARRQASRYHDETAASGADVWRPLAMAHALALAENVDVVPTPAGDPRLSNGRAVWDPAERMIFHEATGNDFQDAFLIAHELGHALLTEGGGRHVATDVDPARVSEQPEIGVDRVGDYSRRERREITMDLFAREFLMPRRWLQSLHLHERRSAHWISERLAAPYPAVAQQLLDALLLPAPDAAATRSVAGDVALDASQHAAATHEGTPLLLEAGPGTGKTRTLVGRVRHLLDSGVDAEQILVLTFSNRAAAELVERISAISPQGAAAMWIGTFHSFGLDLVRRFSDRLDLPAEPRLIDMAEAVGLMEREFLRLDFEHYRDLQDPTRLISDLLRAVSRAKDEVVGPDRYRALAEAMAGGDSVDRAKALEVAAFFQAYEDVKRERNVVDFGDLVTLPVRLVEQNDDVVQALRTRHAHILVDEYQDVNHASVCLLKALAGDGRTLWVVGDARQSIYRFRGASSANMASFAELFPDASSRALAANYRSSEEIVRTFQAFGSDMGPAVSPLSAEEGASGVRPELRVCATSDDELTAVAGAVAELHDAGVAWRDQAVLCKGNDRIAAVARELERRGVPVLFLGVLFERPEIRDMLTLLSLTHDRYGAGLVRLATTPEFQMSIVDAMRVVERMKALADEGSGWKPVRRDGISEDGVAALDRLDRILDGVDADGSPWTLFARTLFDETDLGRRLALSAGPADRSRAIAVWQFMNYARLPSDLGSGTRTARFLERIRRLVILSDERDLRRLPAAAETIDAVRLMTIHGAKGLEFPVVHLPGLDASAMPGPDRGPTCPPPPGMIAASAAPAATPIFDERACLFFVALSRAKRRLVMYRPSLQRGGKRRRNASRYLAPLAGLIQERVVTPSVEPVGASEFRGPTIRWHGAITLRDHKLGLYERCARRFLYTHVLALGGRRSETDYMKMHQAVRVAVDTACVEALSGPLTGDRLNDVFNAAWAAEGPVEDDAARLYRSIAERLFGAFVVLLDSETLVGSPELRVTVGRAEILAESTFASRTGDGPIHIRRVETGRAYADAGDDTSSFLLHQAVIARERSARVTLFHLTGATAFVVTFDADAVSAARAKIVAMLDRMANGDFAPTMTRTCPRCPHYFLCGPCAEGDWPVALDDAA